MQERPPGVLFPSRPRNSATVLALREFYGEDQFYFMYSDNAPELKSACASELMLHLSSTPNRPKSNSIVERFIQLIVEGTRCLLYQSGLPPRYWSLAARAFCLGRNTTLPAHHKATPWAAKNGSEFGGKLMPFGCKVKFRPAEKKDRSSTLALKTACSWGGSSSQGGCSRETTLSSHTTPW